MAVIDAFCEGNDMSNFGSGHSCGECHDSGFVQRCSTNQHQSVCFSWYYFSSMHLLISANTLWQAPLTCSCACPTRVRATLEDHNLRTSSLSTEWFCSLSSTITDYTAPRVSQTRAMLPWSLYIWPAQLGSRASLSSAAPRLQGHLHLKWPLSRRRQKINQINYIHIYNLV